MQTGTGDITVGADVTAHNNVNMDVKSGEINVGAKVQADNEVNMTMGKGNITVGDSSTGKGSVVATNDVNVGVTNGNVNIEKSVESKNGSVTVKTKTGNIHVGNDPNAEDTVKAKQNVTLETENGQITIDGKTSTVEGDIRVKAASEKYDPNGENIVFGQDGKLESGKDAYLIAKNGDLVVTDDVTAKGVHEDGEGRYLHWQYHYCQRRNRFHDHRRGRHFRRQRCYGEAGQYSDADRYG